MANQTVFISSFTCIPTGFKISLSNGEIYRVKASFAQGFISQLESVELKKIKFSIETSGDFKFLKFEESCASVEEAIAHFKKLTKAV